MPFLPLLLVILALSGLTMAALHLYFRSPASAPRRIREEADRRLVGPKFVVRLLLNGLFSGGVVVAASVGLYDHLFYAATPAWWRIVLEVVGVLAVYDFTYYFLHRFPFHADTPLKRVHAVHHMAKNPIAIDSLFLHPVENFAGVALLIACTFIVGPVNVYSFAAIFFIYSQLNVTVHSGLDLPFLGYMSRKHDRHHETMNAGNFASITPLPDLIFGTAE